MSDNFVAETILQQLGGTMFIAMTGAKHLLGNEKGISFHIGANEKKIAGVRIQLNDADTYDVTFLKKAPRDPVFKMSVGMVNAACVTNIHFDQLRDVFTRHTGMATRL